MASPVYLDDCLPARAWWSYETDESYACGASRPTFWASRLWEVRRGWRGEVRYRDALSALYRYEWGASGRASRVPMGDPCLFGGGVEMLHSVVHGSILLESTMTYVQC